MEARGGSSQRGYGGRWQKARITYLKSHQLCVMCSRLGKVTAASVVDHIAPHKGDQALFWNNDNWQSLCKPCHDRHKQRLEKSGTEVGCDTNGIPLDAGHHWHREGGSKV